MKCFYRRWVLLISDRYDIVRTYVEKVLSKIKLSRLRVNNRSPFYRVHKFLNVSRNVSIVNKPNIDFKDSPFYTSFKAIQKHCVLHHRKHSPMASCLVKPTAAIRKIQRIRNKPEMCDIPRLERHCFIVAIPYESNLVRLHIVVCRVETGSSAKCGFHTVFKPAHFMNGHFPPTHNSVFHVKVEEHEFIPIFARLVNNGRGPHIEIKTVVEKILQYRLYSVRFRVNIKDFSILIHCCGLFSQYLESGANFRHSLCHKVGVTIHYPYLSRTDCLLH